MRAYLSRYEIHISAVTVMERVRGYSLLWRRSGEGRRERIEMARIAISKGSRGFGRSIQPPPLWLVKLWL
jgi:hypothetical protein